MKEHRKCETADCVSDAKQGERFCSRCRAAAIKRMEQSGYLQSRQRATKVGDDYRMPSSSGYRLEGEWNGGNDNAIRRLEDGGAA